MTNPHKADAGSVDKLWPDVCLGNKRVFEEWMGRVERPIRRSLEPFARAVDAEGVVQETLLRMWVFAQDRGEELAGENASLRFAIRMARNIARNEARKNGRVTFLPPEELPEIAVAPEPPSDPMVARLIHACLEKLPARPLAALLARIDRGHAAPDIQLARRLKMTLNTFLQNFTRARKQILSCLEANGLPLEELLR